MYSTVNSTADLLTMVFRHLFLLIKFYSHWLIGFTFFAIEFRQWSYVTLGKQCHYHKYNCTTGNKAAEV